MRVNCQCCHFMRKLYFAKYHETHWSTVYISPSVWFNWLTGLIWSPRKHNTFQLQSLGLVVYFTCHYLSRWQYCLATVVGNVSLAVMEIRATKNQIHMHSLTDVGTLHFKVAESVNVHSGRLMVWTFLCIKATNYWFIRKNISLMDVY